jgi:hypothetical protein
MNKENLGSRDKNDQARTANTGNASNPSPGNHPAENSVDEQLLDKNAEKYLRESANIEDVPDANDQQEMENQLDTDEKS